MGRRWEFCYARQPRSSGARHCVNRRNLTGLDPRRPSPAWPHYQPLDAGDDQVGRWNRSVAGAIPAQTAG